MRTEADEQPETHIIDLLSPQIRYVRSINVGRDIDDPNALDGYVITANVQHALGRLSNGFAPSSTQRAWRITGPYGGGKSAFALLIGQLLHDKTPLRQKARELVSDSSAAVLEKWDQVSRLSPLVIPGAQMDPSVVIARQLSEAINARRTSARRKDLLERVHAFIDARSSCSCDASGILPLLQEYSANLRDSSEDADGLLLLIDEMGLFLEYASQPDNDLNTSFFQSLAELAGGRSDTRIAVVAFLHQSFEEYASARSTRSDLERWAKVAERFEEVPFSEPFENVCQLLGNALGAETDILEQKAIAAVARRLYSTAGIAQASSEETTHLSSFDTARLYPLHPLTLVSLHDYVRKYGQNERSLFSFLLSSEAHGLNDFAHRNDSSPATWYRLADLYDYINSLATLRTFDDEKRKRWNLIREVLRSSPLFEPMAQNCLKSISILNLLEPTPGLSVTDETIAFAVTDDPNSAEAKTAIQALIDHGVLYRRSATGELSVWPQTSVNLTDAFEQQSRQVPSLESLNSIVSLLPEARPVFAHRHYFNTGTPRFAEVVIADPSTNIGAYAEKMRRSADALFVVRPVLPAEDLKDAQAQLLAASRESSPLIAFACRRISANDLEKARELYIWKSVRKNCDELRIDAVARREVDANIERSAREVINSLADITRPVSQSQQTEWFYQGQHQAHSNAAQLSTWLSGVFDTVYRSAPIIKNELINRTKLSTAAASGMLRLMEQMYSHPDKEDLEISKTPPEKSIYLSLFKRSNTHRKAGKSWRFAAPRRNHDPNQWADAWAFVTNQLRQAKQTRVSDLVSALAEPPYGVRRGPAILLITAVMKSLEGELSVHEKGRFVLYVDSGHLGRLQKRPEFFELRSVPASDDHAELLDVYRQNLARVAHDDQVGASITEISNELYRWFLELPDYSKQSASIDQRYRLILAKLDNAVDPIQLFATTIPTALGVISEGREISTQSECQALDRELRKFFRAVNSALSDLRNKILDIMATELRLADRSGVREHLIELSEPIDAPLDDYTLNAFVRRTRDTSFPDESWIDGNAMSLGGLPLIKWKDDTLRKYGHEFSRIHAVLKRLHILYSGKSHEHPRKMVAVHVVDGAGHEHLVTAKLEADEQDALRSIRAALIATRSPQDILAHLLVELASKGVEATNTVITESVND